MPNWHIYVSCVFYSRFSTHPFLILGLLFSGQNQYKRNIFHLRFSQWWCRRFTSGMWCCIFGQVVVMFWKIIVPSSSGWSSPSRKLLVPDHEGTVLPRSIENCSSSDSVMSWKIKTSVIFLWQFSSRRCIAFLNSLHHCSVPAEALLQFYVCSLRNIFIIALIPVHIYHIFCLNEHFLTG
jgi:hypothetical protein